MLLKNIGVRLVVVNTAKPKVGTFNIIPESDAVEVPDEGINKHVKAYIEELIAAGELVEVAASKEDKRKTKE